MSLYSLPAQATRSAPACSKVPPGDLPPNTPSDAEHIQRIKSNGLACLGRLHGDLTFEDWLGAGAALQIITAEALAAVDATAWDKDNKRAVMEFNRRWDDYESGAGKNHKPLSKQERSALREVMANPAIAAWRSTLTGSEKRRLTHPKTVLASFKAKAIPAEDRKPSPPAQLKAANVELQEELHQLEQRNEYGSVFSKNDSDKDIANVVIHTFDGLSNRIARVEGVGRIINAWAKQQKKAAQ